MVVAKIYNIVDHDCELKKFYQKDKRVATCSQKLKRRIEGFVQASNSNYRCRLYLRSTAALQAERENHSNSKYWFVIHPFSRFRLYWQMFMVFVFSASLFLIPWSLAFNIDSTRRNNELIVLFLLDLICLIDVVLTFLTGFQDNITKTVILELGKISRRYLRGYFLVDLISSLPLETTVTLILGGDFTPRGEHHTVFAAFGIMSCVKIVRIFTLISLVTEIAEMALMRPSTARCIRMGVLYVVIVHWAACFHYHISVLANPSNLDTAKTSWINVYNLRSASLGTKYLFSLYKATCEMCQIAFEVDYEQPTEEVIVSIVTIVIAATYNSVLFATLLHLVTASHHSEYMFYEIMNQLQAFMFHKQLPMWIQNRLNIYYGTRYDKRYSRDHAILSAMSDPLRRTVFMYTRRHLVQDVAIFEHLPQDVVSSIIAVLKPEIYLTSDMILREGEAGEAMYFIASGSVAILLSDGQEVCHLTDGDYFGELSLMSANRVRLANVLALETCSLLRLDRRDFQRLVVTHEAAFNLIHGVASARLADTSERTIRDLNDPSTMDV